jgi:cell wall-associated NlpC family hydrolase
MKWQPRPRTPAGNILALSVVLAALVGCATTPTIPESAHARASAQQSARATEVALSMVGKPYRYGGDTPAGFDCSGLVSYSYARAGLEISRETRSLRSESMLIRVAELRRGDLVFFDQEGKKYSHVGLYLGDGRFVHAPSSGGHVRIDWLEAEYWRRHFVEARRI